MRPPVAVCQPLSQAVIGPLPISENTFTRLPHQPLGGDINVQIHTNINLFVFAVMMVIALEDVLQARLRDETSFYKTAMILICLGEHHKAH